MRRLFAALRTPTASAFAAYEERYAAWATAEALAAWRRDDDAVTAPALAPFIDPLVRARFVAPRRAREPGRDCRHAQRRRSARRARQPPPLERRPRPRHLRPLPPDPPARLLPRRASRALRPSPRARTPARRTTSSPARSTKSDSPPSARENHAPPKNEAWLPTVVSGDDVLAEPQQTSDTTYSLADFYTPFTWGGDRPRFRKGARDRGVAREDLAGYVAHVDFSPRPPSPRFVALPNRSRATRTTARSSSASSTSPRAGPSSPRTSSAPPFAGQSRRAHRARPSARRLPAARRHPRQGRPRRRSRRRGGALPRAPGFIPATIAGTYTLAAHEPSTVLIYSVPGVRRAGRGSEIDAALRGVR